jgi:glutamate synthase domain-containing protein 3
LEKALDHTLLEWCKPVFDVSAKEDIQPLRLSVDIRNTHRTVGTILSSALTRRFKLGMYTGSLNEDTIWFDCHGTAGQSFHAFGIKGLSMCVHGEANDYCGKGLSGGKIIVRPPEALAPGFVPEDNIIVGNVALFGATSGEAYFRGKAGERFCVRNSGAWAVVEGVGDHGCEYMTGGRAVILGATGRNFASGMSGGIAFVYDPRGDFEIHCNAGSVDIKPMHPKGIEELRYLLERHVLYTESSVAQHILSHWDQELKHFVRIMPRDYARVLRELEVKQASPAALQEV